MDFQLLKWDNSEPKKFRISFIDKILMHITLKHVIWFSLIFFQFLLALLHNTFWVHMSNMYVWLK
jgi:hypothetical protein